MYELIYQVINQSFDSNNNNEEVCQWVFRGILIILSVYFRGHQLLLRMYALLIKSRPIPLNESVSVIHIRRLG